MCIPRKAYLVAIRIPKDSTSRIHGHGHGHGPDWITEGESSSIKSRRTKEKWRKNSHCPAASPLCHRSPSCLARLSAPLSTFKAPRRKNSAFWKQRKKTKTKRERHEEENNTDGHRKKQKQEKNQQKINKKINKKSTMKSIKINKKSTKHKQKINKK